jgi:hypothetical protein
MSNPSTPDYGNDSKYRIISDYNSDSDYNHSYFGKKEQFSCFPIEEIVFILEYYLQCMYLSIKITSS